MESRRQHLQPRPDDAAGRTVSEAHGERDLHSCDRLNVGALEGTGRCNAETEARLRAGNASRRNAHPRRTPVAPGPLQEGASR